jgi:hypothetical protein
MNQAELQTIQAQILVQRGLLLALAALHPDPEALRREFHDRMERLSQGARDCLVGSDFEQVLNNKVADLAQDLWG